jgi:hypothetical protein
VGEAARRRGKREEDQSGDEDRLAADQVAEPAGEEQETAVGDQVAVDDPRQVGLGEVQVGLDGRQGDVDDGPVEGVHELSEADDHEGEPPAAGGEPARD